MTSSRPYLIRALHEWIVDNGLTPHIVVKADFPGNKVPERYAQDGRLVLNIAPAAVRGLELSNEAVHFSARFSGTPMQVVIPTGAVLAIYARENGQGMAFPEEEAPPPPPPEPEKPEGSEKPGPP